MTAPTLTPLDALFLPASHVERLPDEDAAEPAEDALFCDACAEAVVTEEGEPRACECEREADGEHAWEGRDER